MNSHTFPKQFLLKGLSLVALTLMLSACGEEPKEGAAAPARPLPKVAVISVEPQSIANLVNVNGRVEASMTAEIRPQVSGIIQQKLFTEGSMVKQGQSLYRIDSAAYQAEYDSALAEVKRAQSVVENAALTTKRNKQVVKINAISAQEVDNAIAAEREARASLIASQAALQMANINLQRTYINSPIDGVVGRSLVTQGALVTVNQAEPLAVVQVVDPLYVDFALPSEQVKAVNVMLSQQENKPTVSLTLANGTIYPQVGNVKFVESLVDRTMDSVVLRVEFPNPDATLVPGLFVRGQLQLGQQKDVILIPPQALNRNAKGEASVMVLNAQSEIGLKPVVENGLLNGQWIITAGLVKGDQVIIKGLQFIRPGAKAQLENSTPVSNTSHTNQKAAGEQ